LNNTIEPCSESNQHDGPRKRIESSEWHGLLAIQALIPSNLHAVH
jgi:hypothetical protein